MWSFTHITHTHAHTLNASATRHELIKFARVRVVNHAFTSLSPQPAKSQSRLSFDLRNLVAVDCEYPPPRVFVHSVHDFEMKNIFVDTVCA